MIRGDVHCRKMRDLESELLLRVFTGKFLECVMFPKPGTIIKTVFDAIRKWARHFEGLWIIQPKKQTKIKVSWYTPFFKIEE